jgi:hypothetical protein
VLPRAEYHYKSAISGSSNIMNFKFNWLWVVMIQI